MEPHAAGEVTEELVLFSIGEHDANAKGRIRKALFHAADKLNDLLTHIRRVEAGKARECYRGKKASTSSYEPKNPSVTKIVLQKTRNIL